MGDGRLDQDFCLLCCYVELCDHFIQKFKVLRKVYFYLSKCVLEYISIRVTEKALDISFVSNWILQLNI